MTGTGVVRGRQHTDRRIRTLLVLSAVIALAVSLTPPADSAPVGVDAAAADARAEVFVTFADAPGTAGSALVRRAGGEIRYAYDLVPTIAASVPAAALDGLQAAPGVVAVEPIGTVHAVVGPTDEQLAAELTNTWGVERIGAGQAHGAGHLADGVRVAVLDSGQAAHQDLVLDSACSWHPATFPSVDDGSGHGTHVAGTVGALRDGFGVVGAAPDVQLCAMKVLDDDGNGSYADVIAALDHIVVFNEGLGPEGGPPIRITNNSYGSSGDPGVATKAAFDAAAAAGVLHIGAAGNNGQLPARFATCIYPALYDSVVAVAATTKNDGRANFSSRCGAVELAAPGVDINSTSHTSDRAYRLASGTSMASPHVAGSAALVMAACPALSGAGVRTLLGETALPLGAQTSFGSGLVQPWGAIERCWIGSGDGSGGDGGTGDEGGPGGDDGTGGDGGGDEVSPIRLTADGYKVKGVHHADLTWSGATTPTVDIIRDGVSVTVVSNSVTSDKVYTDDTIGKKGGGSYEYQLCEMDESTTGASVCSATVTVEF